MCKTSKLSECVLGLILITVITALTWVPGVAAQVSFDEDVFPVIKIRCLECHQPGGSGYEKSGLDLSTYEGLMKGTKHGPVVKPGNALESNILRVIDRRTSRKIWMPHERKQLSRCERQALRFCVMQGALDN